MKNEKNPALHGLVFSVSDIKQCKKHFIMKKLFAFSRRDRNGLMVLIIIIIVGAGFSFLYSKTSIHERMKQEEFIRQSSKFLAELNVVGITTGVSERKQIPKAEMQQASIVESINVHSSCNEDGDSIPIVDLNKADSAELTALPGIGPVYASRILKYRKLLGGYSRTEQLTEVYGFDTSAFQKIEKYLTLDTDGIVKLDINTIEFKQLLKHPYFDYELTKTVFNARRDSLFASREDFIARTGLSDSDGRKISSYLSF